MPASSPSSSAATRSSRNRDTTLSLKPLEHFLCYDSLACPQTITVFAPKEDFYEWLSANEVSIEALHIKYLYNSRFKSTTLWRPMPGPLHNVTPFWFNIAIKRMYRSGFLKELHCVDSCITESEDEEYDDGNPGRKIFLLMGPDIELTNFLYEHGASAHTPDYVVMDNRASYPSMCVELGRSQGYDRSPDGNGLLDRVDVLLCGTAGKIRAVIVINIEEKKDAPTAKERLRGFVELWRYNNGRSYRDSQRLYIEPDSPAYITLLRSDVYGSSLPRDLPPEPATFRLKISWLWTVLRDMLPVQQINDINSKTLKRRKREGDDDSSYLH